MNTKNFFVITILVLSLALGACKPGSPTEGSPDDARRSPLVGTQWTLTHLDAQAVLDTLRPNITFEDGKLSGNDGCNNFGGSYTLKGDQITVGEEMYITLMACQEPVMAQEEAFIDALLEAKTYQITGSELTLLDAGGKALAVFSAQSTNLVGTSWTVTSYYDGRGAVVSVLAGSTVTAGFREDGRIVGSGGCNNYTATYELSEAGIKIGPAVSTKMACKNPAGVMEQEMQFLAALSGATAYQLSGDVLELRTADGTLVVSLVRAP